MAIMNPLDDRLLREALRLPPDARAALAGSLLDSLESDPDPEAEAEWVAEIARRVAAWDADQAQGVPWAEARRAILDD